MNSVLPPIIIELPPEEQTSGAVSKTITQTNSTGNGSLLSGSAKSALKKVVSYAAVKHVVDQTIGYAISNVELQTGAREYEQTLQWGYQVASETIGTGIMVAGAFMAGHPLLALAGLAVSGISKGYEIYKNYNRLQIQENREDISIQMAIVRAGSLGRRNNGGKNGPQ